MLEENASLNDTDAAPENAAAPKPRRRRGMDRMAIGVGALVVLGAGGLYYMHARTAAAVAMVGEADAQAASVDAMLAGGRDGLASLSRDVDDTRGIITRFTSRDTAALARSRNDDRDPFEFRSLESKAVAPLPGSTNNASREAARAQATAAAQRLQLQSIMVGSAKRSCLIDGKLYFEGQTLGEFTLGRITPDAVVIQSGEFRFELRLRK